MISFDDITSDNIIVEPNLIIFRTVLCSAQLARSIARVFAPSNMVLRKISAQAWYQNYAYFSRSGPSAPHSPLHIPCSTSRPIYSCVSSQIRHLLPVSSPDFVLYPTLFPHLFEFCIPSDDHPPPASPAFRQNHFHRCLESHRSAGEYPALFMTSVHTLTIIVIFNTRCRPTLLSPPVRLSTSPPGRRTQA